jgi:DNA polymerase alpha subunit B
LAKESRRKEMADAEQVAELNERFAAGDKKLEPDMVAELQSIMRMHSLSVQDLFFKWESYCIKMDLDGTTLSVDNLRNLKRDIQDALERDNRNMAQTVKFEKNAKGSSGTPRNVIRNGGDVSDMWVKGVSNWKRIMTTNTASGWMG